MKVVRPIEITEAVLTASSIPEPDVSVGEVEWQADRFSGVDMSAETSSSEKIVDLSVSGGFIYALRIGPLGAGDVLKLNLDGTPTGTEINTAGALSLFVSTSIWVTTGALGNVKQYSLAGALLNTFDVSAQTENPQGICSDGTSFYVYDIKTKKIYKYTSAFVYDNQEFSVESGSECLGLEYKDGFIYTSNRSNASVVQLTTSGSVVNSFSLSFNMNPFKNSGVSFIGDKVLVAKTDLDGGVGYFYLDGKYDALYLNGDRVIKTSTHKLYECTIATADDPEVGVDKVPQTWVEVGPTNKWAVFDDKKSTKSKTSSPYTIQLVPGVTIDSLAGFAISGATDVTIVATSASAGEVFNETINLLNIDLAYDFYTWYTYELDYIDEFVVANIPPYPDLTIDISFTGSVIEVGNIVTGRGRNLGVLQTGAISDRVDYSRTTIDDFGEETTVIRPITKYSTYPIVIEKVQAPGVLRFLDGLRGLKCVWIGDIGNGQNLTTFGSIERSPLTYDTLSISEYQIKVRGSI